MAQFFHSIDIRTSAEKPKWKRFTVHLATLPDGTQAGIQQVEVGVTSPVDHSSDSRIAVLPKRLFFEVETNDGYLFVIDADIPNDGLPITGNPGSAAIKAVTITKKVVDCYGISVKKLNSTKIDPMWVVEAFAAAAASYNGGSQIKLNFGPDAPENFPDPTAGREMTRRLMGKSSSPKGRPKPDIEKVEKAVELKNLGRSFQQVADELGIGKTTARSWIEKAKAGGEIDE